MQLCHPRTFFFPVTQQLIASGVIQKFGLLLMISAPTDEVVGLLMSVRRFSRDNMFNNSR